MGMTYLGIKLTPGLEKIMHVNITPVIQNIRSLLQNWAKIYLSLLGRINLVDYFPKDSVYYVYVTFTLPACLNYTTELWRTLCGRVKSHLLVGLSYMLPKMGAVWLCLKWTGTTMHSLSPN